MITGLRVDHIDGLFDPEGYIRKLRKLLGDDFYIVVEKILEQDESLPVKWNVQGTSGYDFLAEVNLLFTSSEKEEEFSKHYKKISPQFADYEKLVYEKKLFILKQRMAGELNNLIRLQKDLELFPDDEENRKNREEALSAFLASFPVYRIYPKSFPLNRHQEQIIDTAHSHALKFCPEREAELKELKQVFRGEADKAQDNMLYYLQRCQQFSGPLAAKGGEDTSFYIYNRLISHNEVGDSPDNFGVSVKEFHKKMLQHKQNFPYSINATATHDTKRGEDARMRLNVLSEIPQEWFSKVEEWKELNSDIWKRQEAPGSNEEYFIYQTLVAAMPYEGNSQPNFHSRTKAYLQKVLREAKVHSNWADPDEKYEQGVFEFLEDILAHQPFRESLDKFRKKINAYGVIKSLGQTLVKITAPGVPDVYQGTELWDLSYVDPDNRRPVNYVLRKGYLAEFKDAKGDDLNKKISRFTDSYNDAKVKMFCLWRALAERKKNKEVFETGDYVPLEITGKASGEFAAFARRNNDGWLITVVPVMVTGMFPPETTVADPEKLKGSAIKLPGDAPEQWVNSFTDQQLDFKGEIALDLVLQDFPVCLLKNKK
jgi:(1->4)-alpha-D-glucan 1-alpha-D-glucosylmutase